MLRARLRDGTVALIGVEDALEIDGRRVPFADIAQIQIAETDIQVKDVGMETPDGLLQLRILRVIEQGQSPTPIVFDLVLPVEVASGIGKALMASKIVIASEVPKRV